MGGRIYFTWPVVDSEGSCHSRHPSHACEGNEYEERGMGSMGFMFDVCGCARSSPVLYTTVAGLPASSFG